MFSPLHHDTDTLPVIVLGLVRHPGYREVGTRPCPAPETISLILRLSHYSLFAYPPGAGGETSWLLLRRQVVSEWTLQCLVTSGHNGPHVSLAWPAHLDWVQVTSDYILYSHFTYLKTSNTDEVWYFFTIKSIRTKAYFVCVMLVFMEVLQNILNNESGVGTKVNHTSLCWLT